MHRLLLELAHSTLSQFFIGVHALRCGLKMTKIYININQYIYFAGLVGIIAQIALQVKIITSDKLHKCNNIYPTPITLNISKIWWNLWTKRVLILYWLYCFGCDPPFWWRHVYRSRSLTLRTDDTSTIQDDTGLIVLYLQLWFHKSHYHILLK